MQSLNKFRTPNTNKAMGIEIECVMEALKADSCQYKHNGFFYGTCDGSIQCPWNRTGVEFVSQPLSAAWLKKEINKLARKFEWETNESCGVHVHVSRKWLSMEKAKAINAFLFSLLPSETVELFGREENTYCRTYVSLDKEDRYCSINITNTATIEFRMFKSGDAKWCAYCVDMVEYLINNAHHLNVDAALAFKDCH